MRTRQFTKELVQFVTETEYGALPKKIIKDAKRLILDTIGCGIGGSVLDAGQKLIQTGKVLEGGNQSSILVTGDKVSCATAAFVNSGLGNVLDADETLLNSSHHATSVVFPALAVGEYIKASGKDLICAVVLGFDIAARIGLSLDFAEITPERKIQFSPIAGMQWATFGAVVASGKLLKLNKETLENAIGIAGANSPVASCGKWGLEVRNRPYVKYGFYPFMSYIGVVSALLAENGFTGYRDILDGDLGYWRMVGSSTCNWDIMVDGLGKKWWLSETSFKPYPSCRYTHHPIDLIFKIMSENKLKPHEIDKIIVRVHSVAIRQHLGENYKPENQIDAEFSIPYLVAVAVSGIKPGPDWHNPSKLQDQSILELAKKVKVELEPSSLEPMLQELEKEGRFKKAPTSVEIICKGKSFRAQTDYARGDPWAEEFRMSDAELQDKFKMLSSGILPNSKIDSAIKLLSRLDDLENIAELRDAITC